MGDPLLHGQPGLDRNRAPMIAPIPMSAVLRIGPIGLLKVFTAIATAKMKPTAAPIAVVANRDGSIHLRARAMAAAATHPINPPTTPPIQSPLEPTA
jgi:hypothetical protein